jgi:hypothetical protein
MRKLMLPLLVLLLLAASQLAQAKVLGVEFNFTPYVGELAKDKVDTVAGKAQVFVNNVPVAQQDIGKKTVPVIFDDREVGSALWITAQSMGPALRRGANKLRIEFTPANGTAAYAMQLRWAFVTDQERRSESGPGQVSSTNQAGEGADNRQGLTGKLVVEREFSADFPADLPWHHYPPVAALTDADKQELAALVAARAQAFKPDFAQAYELLGQAHTGGIELDLAGIRKAKILNQGYAAGVRIAPPAMDKMAFVLTGNPEVVLRGAGGGPLFAPDPKALQRIKGEQQQFGMAMVLSVLFPPQLVVVRDPAGKWQVAY